MNETLPGCVDPDGFQDCAASVDEVEKGVWKAAPENLEQYNQYLCDRRACTYTAGVTAISNFLALKYGKSFHLTPDQFKAGFEDFRSSGLFHEDWGAKISDGVFYAAKTCNAAFEKAVKLESFPLNINSIIYALKKGSPVVTGIRYGAKYIWNEQDDAIIQDLPETTGSQGHAITIIKANTMEDQWVKYLENYAGVLFNGAPRKQVIRTVWGSVPGFWQNNGIRFYE